MKTPVALFVFNRPAHTQRVLRAIATARPDRLLIVADGPRDTHPDDARLCGEARAAAEAVDWPCQVERFYSSTNLGCRQRVASGLDLIFSSNPEAIILEDDCLPNPTFFPFCEELLARYRTDEAVQMITGTNFLMGRRASPDSYYFSRFCRIWGWATWARAWKHYDIRMRRWPELRDTDWLERLLPTPPMAALARQIFDETYYHDRFTTWDYQWVFASWLQRAVVAVPEVNLVTNIGYDAAASHTRNGNDPLANLATSPMPFPLRHPGRVIVNNEADIAEWAIHYPELARQEPWTSRLRRYARRVFGRSADTLGQPLV